LAGLAGAPKRAQNFGSRRVEQAVAVQMVSEAFDGAEGRICATLVLQCDGPIKRDHRRPGELEQHVVQRDDLRQSVARQPSTRLWQAAIAAWIWNGLGRSWGACSSSSASAMALRVEARGRPGDGI
jgi:hypothetical protein